MSISVRAPDAPACGRRRSASCCDSAPIRRSSPSAAATRIRRCSRSRSCSEIYAELLVRRARGCAAVHGFERPAGVARPGRRAAEPGRDALHRRRRVDHPGRPAGPRPGRQARGRPRRRDHHREPDVPRRADRVRPDRAAYAAVRTDDDGMDTDDLDEVLAAHPNAKMIYTVPDFQNPTGVTLSLPRRRRLIELANAYGVLVRRGHALPRAALRGRRPADPEEPRHRGPGAAPRQLLQDPGPGDAPRLGRGERRRSWSGSPCSSWPRTPRTAPSTWPPPRSTCGRYDIDAHIATALPVYRHKRDLMLATMRGDLPRRRRPHDARRRAVHLADLPGRLRRRRGSWPRRCCRRRRWRTCPARRSSPYAAAEPRPAELLRRARRPAGARRHGELGRLLQRELGGITRFG